MSRLEVWLRPWALAEASGKHRFIPGETWQVPPHHTGTIWAYQTARPNASVAPGPFREIEGFGLSNEVRVLGVMAMPLRQQQPHKLVSEDRVVSIEWPTLPNRPSPKAPVQTDGERDAHELMQRAKAVWERLHDVEFALFDPANLWPDLQRRWTADDEHFEPRMDIIVKHAMDLSRTLDEIDRSPRRVLRRTHEMVPVSRVQEMDRRAMSWLAKQPGTTLAQRAGDSQRILAVARQENFDTLENRVVRAYCELASYVARDYLDRNGGRGTSVRIGSVREFSKRCRRLSRDLAALGVRNAEPGVTPNFVLQQNPRYHAVWEAWQDLLARDRLDDDLWRWQSVSWEEFCALALMVAVSMIPGAQLLASAPVAFRDEQSRGSWVEQDNPLGVFYLPEQNLVIDIQFRQRSRSSTQADLGTQLWLKFARSDDPNGFQKYAPVWALWDRDGSGHGDDLSEINSLMTRYRSAGVVAGLVVRPGNSSSSAPENQGCVSGITIGTHGTPLKQGIAAMATFVTQLLTAERWK